MRLLGRLLLGLACIGHPAVGLALTVTTTADDGAGSLRAAIVAANADADLDVIDFAISDASHIIVLLAPLPAITEPVHIDGTTEPDFEDVPIVELDGSSLPAGSAGLALSDHTGSTVRGLLITRVPGDNSIGGGDGILVSGGGGHTISGNYLGTDGSADLGNRTGLTILRSSDCIVGGKNAGDRNLISGNETGILLRGTVDTLIEGNFIGTDASGTTALGNGRGIFVFTAFSPIADTMGTLIGGRVPEARNLISGNGIGITVSTSATEESRNRIEGNLIGTDVTGTTSLANTGNGIAVSTAAFVTIGGDVVDAANVIAGHLGNGNVAAGAGVVIESLSTDAAVLGNYIGTDRSGTIPIPNDDGVRIRAGVGAATDSRVAGNLIAYNNESGIVVISDGGHPVRHTFSANAIVDNGDLGIDLGADDVTPNDTGDPDEGANGLQNFPELTSVQASPTGTTVTGSLSGPAATTFTVELFESDAADPSGFGEGERFVAAFEVTTDGSGTAAIAEVLEQTVTAGYLITATATSPDGSTSELSAAIVASAVGTTTTSSSTSTSVSSTSTTSSETTTTSAPSSSTTSMTNTSSTSPLPTTTTTSTSAPSSVPSTTSTSTSTSLPTTSTVAPSTTTTTLPPCASDTSFPALGCRLGDFRAQVNAIAPELGALQQAVTTLLAKADDAVAKAQTSCDEGKRGPARKRLAQAAKQLRSAQKKITSKKGRRTVPPALADTLARDLSTFVEQLKALRKTETCS